MQTDRHYSEEDLDKLIAQISEREAFWKDDFDLKRDLAYLVLLALRQVRAERDEVCTALREIRETCGAVCAEFESCNHTVCESSYRAWAIADKALAAAEPKEAK